MMNRLLLPWQWRLLLIASLIPWTLSLNAQCDCFTVNGSPCIGTANAGAINFSVTYTGSGTIHVSNACTADLTQLIAEVTVNHPVGNPPTQLISGGYNSNSMIPAGEVVTFSYFYPGGDSDTLCYEIAFTDNTPPELNYTVQNVSVDCGMADYNAWWNAQVDSLEANSTDNCGVDTVYHSGPVNFIDNCGVVLDTFFVADTFGNVTFSSATYTITDSEDPVFTSFPADLMLQCSDAIPAPASVTATDNCAATVTPILVGQDTTTLGTGACAPYKFEIRRTWRITDGCGNIVDSIQVISVDDTTLPDFDLPPDTTIVCDSPTGVGTTGDISNLTDNCTSAMDLVTTLSTIIEPGLCPEEETIKRTWKVTDACGNSISKTQVITVIDTVAPVAVFPADITVACFVANGLPTTGEPTMVSDNCDTAPDTTFSDVVIAGSCPNSFTVNRTWTVEDGCGNSISGLQVITVNDTIAPVVNTQAVNRTVTCDVDILAAFDLWINQHGSAEATDNCTIPSDSLSWEAFNAGTNTPAFLPGPDCLNPTQGIYRRVTVDFVVSDKCGNRDTTTATFTVADNQPPTLVNCPSSFTVDTDPGVCFSNQTLLLPVVMEDCGNTTVVFNQSISLTPTIPAGSNPIETPINDLVYNFSVNGPPYTTLTNAILTIELENLDAEAPTEFLEVIGEGGLPIGQVAHTAAQCGDTVSTFVISTALIDQWAYDGLITITVRTNVPANLPGRFAVNPICPGNLVTASLSYDANFPAGLQLAYSVNNSGRIPVSPIQPINVDLNTGTNTIAYYFVDCANNESTCNFEVTVEDNEAPEILCPADMSVNLDPGACNQDVEVPLFSGVTDNCGVTIPSVQVQPQDSLSSLLTFSYNPNLGDYVADDKTFVFSGLQGNATPGGVQLIIALQGDVDSVGAYFEIYDNDNNFLGTTSYGNPNVTAGNCNTPSVATFTIPAATFNDWASTGDITITARSFMNYPIPPAGPTWGINPCDPGQVSNDGDTDGSYMTATFSYESVTPVFSAVGATSIGPDTLTPPLEAAIYTLEQGITTFTYAVTDLAGNDGECSFDINIVDAEAPDALCGPAFVDINPSGFDQDTVFADEIDLGSTDNCTIASMVVTPNIFDCNDVGTQNVTLTVTDQAGNVSVCSTFVNVTTQKPQPTAFSDCGSADLQLFANPPASSGGGNIIYNYIWRDPNGVVFSFDENPVIQDADENDLGFYTVTVQGVTFCESMGSVQVTCDLLPLKKPVVEVDDNNICASETIELSTEPVCGTGVTYNWYTGPFPGALMATTTQPNYTMLPPASGNFSFYVIVERNNCETEVSEEVQVQVNSAPVATASQDNVVICAGESLTLQSLNVPLGASCHWTGPCGFESFNCSPGAIANVDNCNSGFYQLIVTNNGCESIPDTVVVNVVTLPATPNISNTTSSNNPACHGESIVLTATPVTGAVSYEWTTPMFSTMTTATNTLTLPNVDISKDAGQWRVRVIGNPCDSELSAPTTVYIEPLPEAVAAAANPVEVCEGQSVQLSASSASQNVNFKWDYPNGQTNALQNPVLNNVTSTSTGTYTLTVTNQFGCSVESTVDVNVLERVQVTGIASDAPACVNGPVNVHLQATLFPLDPGSYQYLWTGPNGFSSTNASATISNGTADDSGPYTLVVTNTEGCSSQPITLDVAIPEVLPTPASPTLGLPNPYCEGESVTLTTTPFNGSNAVYVWQTPTGTFTTSNPSLTIDDLTVSEAGTYSVQYDVNDCPSGMSGTTTLVVNAKPLIQPSSNSPVCEGQLLELDVQCTAGAVYEWSGPSGFNPSVCNPVIPNANPDQHSGTYSVRVRVNGCWSDLEPVNVEVKEKPSIPTAINAGPYCANTEDVMLSVTPNSATPGAVYTWFDENGVPLGNNTPSLNFGVPNATQLGNGTFEFYVQASLDGCPSTASVPTVVVINTIPSNQAEAGPDISACEGDIITLMATPPTIGSGLWTLAGGNPAGVSIANPDEATTTVAGLVPGQNYLFEWSLSNGACEDYSSDQVEVFINLIEEADAGEPITACHTTLVNLDGNTPVSNVGMWSQPQSQSMLGVTIVDPDNPNTAITGLVPGNSYIFTWTIDGGCGSSADAVLVTVTNENAFAGIDFEDCGDGCTELNAVGALSGVGAWSSPDAAIEFTTPTDPLTSVCNLRPGKNLLIWTIDDGACGQFSVDSIFVEYQYAAELQNDLVDVEFAGEAIINVTQNDDIPGFFSIGIVQDALHGQTEIGFDGELTYDADVNFVGEDVLIYEVCIDGCECETAIVTFNVGADAGCIAPSIITPNGDGMNDAFVIPCLGSIDTYPSSVVRIYNQWGDEVFYAAPYQNNWRGTFDGEDLPAATYFYVVDLGDGSEPMSGYLIVQR